MSSQMPPPLCSVITHNIYIYSITTPAKDPMKYMEMFHGTQRVKWWLYQQDQL